MDEVNKRRLTPEREAEIRRMFNNASWYGYDGDRESWFNADVVEDAIDDLFAEIDALHETERQFTRLRTDADKFRDLIRTLLDMPENAAPTVNWCEQHGEDISTFLPGGAWWEHDPADMLPKLDAGEIQEALAMYVLNVDRMEVRRMLEAWRAGKETA